MLSLKLKIFKAKTFNPTTGLPSVKFDETARRANSFI